MISKKRSLGAPAVRQWVKSLQTAVAQIPGPPQCVKGSGIAAAVVSFAAAAQIQFQAWQLSHTVCEAIKFKKRERCTETAEGEDCRGAGPLPKD